MDRPDDVRKRRQRAAYTEYVHLQWHLYGLAHDDPARAALHEMVRAAEQQWRSLMGTLSAVTNGQIVILGDPHAGRDERGAATGPYSE
jgi:hypothetical protein